MKIVDVARAAGVSPTTVSHALNDRGNVDPETRASVKRVARGLGYLPNRRAQRLRTGEAHMILLVSSMPFAIAAGPSRLGFLMEIAAVAASAALSRGLALVLVPPAEGNEFAIEGLDVDGALVVEPAQDDARVSYLLQRGLPVLTIGKQPGASPPPFVDLRSEETTLQLLEHLRGQGARCIGLLIGSQLRTSYLEAAIAYRDFAARTGMRPVVQTADERRGEEGGESAALLLIAQCPQIDAICAPVDAFAVGAVRALGSLGLRVPRDVMVATRYDGLRARHCNPPLTCLNLHLDELATQAIDLLLQHLGGGPRLRELDGRRADLVARASTQRLDG